MNIDIPPEDNKMLDDLIKNKKVATSKGELIRFALKLLKQYYQKEHILPPS